MRPTENADTEKRPFVVGVTGGVGAGKSTVLSFLESLPGARVVEADRTGHFVMEPGTNVFSQIRTHFGEGIIRDGRIDRAALGEIVFSDKTELAWLNGVVHPAVKDWIRRELQREREKGDCSLFVIEAALLIEDHYEELCEEFWYIYASPEARRERLKASRGYSEEKIEAVFRNQQPDAVFRARCQEVIDNGGERERTLWQVRELLRARGLPFEPQTENADEGKGDIYR